MENYLNLHGNSNVKFYEIHDDYIDIVFHNTPFKYRYSNKVPGPDMLENLKKLARQGHGLNGYISSCVKFNYEKKIPLNRS